MFLTATSRISQFDLFIPGFYYIILLHTNVFLFFQASFELAKVVKIS